MNCTHIFIGPRKTGTSWLHHVVDNTSEAKEIRYPVRFGRRYVYNRHVAGRSLLIWPYLVHEPDSLYALLEDLENAGVQPSLYWSERDEDDWKGSMVRFLGKYGVNKTEATERTENDYRCVRAVLADLERKYDVERVRIIQPKKRDLQVLASACNSSEEELDHARAQRVYETNERSNIPSEKIVNFFFKIKPFIPDTWQRVTKVRVFRNIFFEIDENSKKNGP